MSASVTLFRKHLVACFYLEMSKVLHPSEALDSYFYFSLDN